MAKKKKFKAVKTTLWGVFHVGTAWDPFRTLQAAFSEKKDADAWSHNYSIEHFDCRTMVEEIKVTIPAWDGNCD